jgi:hypothetical protein
MDTRDFGNPSADFQNKISEYIHKSGFPLELTVRDQIIKANSKLPNPSANSISHQSIYIDPDDGKVRETDINWFVSSWHKPDPSIYYNYFFECKSSEKYSWIFFTEPVPSNQYWYSFAHNMMNLQLLPDLADKPNEVLGSPLFYRHVKKIAHSYLTYPENSPDNIRTAVFQSIKAGFVELEHYLEDSLNDENEYVVSAALFFPVIVYSGYLFEYEHNSETGVNILSPANRIVLRVEHSFNAHKLMFLVDIVRADYLASYLDQQVLDMKKIHEYIKKVKPSKRAVKIKKIL